MDPVSEAWFVIPVCQKIPSAETKAELLPNHHPFANDPKAQEKYRALLGPLQFPPIYNPLLTPSQVRRWMQDSLHLEPDPTVKLDPTDRQILASLPNHQPAMAALLQDLVAVNSQTKETEGNAQVREKLAKELEAIGFSIQHFPEAGVTVAKHHPANFEGKRVLLIGHTDTVLSPAAFSTPLCRTEQQVYGPGVADMKGGLVVMIAALKALHDSGVLSKRHLTVLFNSDEEIGSPKSTPIIEAYAKKHDQGLVFESGKPTPSKGGGLTLGRKGILMFDLTVLGKNAHAGVDHYRGVDAGRIAARITETLSALTDYEQGVTANVGIIETNKEPARNAVLHEVRLQGEFRYWNPEEQKILEDKAKLLIRGAMTCNPLVEAGNLVCSDYRLVTKTIPPAPVTEERRHWFGQIAALGQAIDFPLEAVTSGGASNQSTAAAVGLNVIDSFGPVGFGTHTQTEGMNLETFVPRAQLAALVIHHALTK